MVQISNQKFKCLKKACSNLLSPQNCGGTLTRTDLLCELYYMPTSSPSWKIAQNSLSLCILTFQPWLEIRGKRTYHNFWEHWKFEMVEFSHKRRPGLYFSKPVLQTLRVYCSTCSKQRFPEACQRSVRLVLSLSAKDVSNRHVQIYVMRWDITV